MTSRPMILGDMTWRELEESLDLIEVALVPVGALEQHGPNLSMRCDAALAEEVALRLEKRYRPRVLVAPTIPLGISEHHMSFLGTISLREGTLIAIARDVVSSLMRHGLRRFLFINGHGGNIPALSVACSEIERDLSCPFVAASTYFASYDTAVDAEYPDCGKGGHACGMEVSLALSLRPDLVRSGALEAHEPGPRLAEGDVVLPLVENRALEMPYDFREITLNGCLGDAREASEAYGDAMVESILERIGGLIEMIAREYA